MTLKQLDRLLVVCVVLLILASYALVTLLSDNATDCDCSVCVEVEKDKTP